jgi:hypothetical protein
MEVLEDVEDGGARRLHRRREAEASDGGGARSCQRENGLLLEQEYRF